MKKFAPLLLGLLLIGCPPPEQPTPNQEQAAASSAAPLLSQAEISQIQSGVAVTIVLDTSGSMEGEKLLSVKRVLLTSIKDKLNLYSVMGSGNLQLALIDCGSGWDSAEVEIPLNRYDELIFSRKVAGLTADGGTPLGLSMNLAFTELAKSGCVDKHVFVLSDGQSQDDLQSALAHHDPCVTIHVIGFQTDSSNYAAFSEVGGQVIMVDDAETLDATTSKIFKAILKLEDE